MAIAEDRQAQNIHLLDVRQATTVMDYALIITGTSSPHLKALFDEIQVALKKEGVHAYRKSGQPGSGWLVLDYVDVVIHIFDLETRDYYSIEELWEGALPVE